MNCIVCDECGKRTTVDPVFQRRPSGWITVSQVDPKGDREDGDYCSAACAVIKLTQHLMDTQRPMLVKG